MEKSMNLENVLQAINSRFISLLREEVIMYNAILHQIINEIVKRMRAEDKLFDQLYNGIFYGGSFYDDLKVERPDEYDIHLLLNLPIENANCNEPGYVFAKVTDTKNYEGITKYCESIKSENYLNTTKILSWIESILDTILKKFPSDSELRYNLKNICNYNIYTKIHKTGPAFTLKINGNIKGHNIEMSVDLVVCFIIDNNKPNSKNYRKPQMKNRYFIVPKKPKSLMAVPKEKSGKYWRVSNQEEERQFMKNLGRAKPALRLLKKLRITQGHDKIASYFLKTILLWKIKDTKDRKSTDYWHKSSLSNVFMDLLIEYKDCILNEEVLNFWDKNDNIIGSIDPETLQNIGNRLEYIIADIKRNGNNPLTVVKYILTEEEQLEFDIFLENRKNYTRHPRRQYTYK